MSVQRASGPSPAIVPVSLDTAAAELLDGYAGSLRAKPTRDHMRQALGRLRALPGVTSMADVTEANILRLVRGMIDRGLARATIRTILARLETVCAFWVRRGYLAANPVRGRKYWLPHAYRGGSAPRPGPAAPSPEQLERLLCHLLDGSTSWEGHRLLVLVALVVYAGLRRNEALGLAWADVDLPAGRLRVAGRAPGRAWAAIPAKLAEVLRAWQPRCGKAWVIPQQTHDRPWRDGNPANRPIGQVRRAGRAVGLEDLTFERLAACGTAAEGRPSLPAFEARRPPRRAACGPQPARPGPRPGTVPLLLLKGPDWPPVVRGRALAAPLSPKRYALLRAMHQAGCARGARLATTRLVQLSGSADAVRELRRMRRIPGLDGLIDFPGARGRGGYGFKLGDGYA